jgi:hypothetical protein
MKPTFRTSLRQFPRFVLAGTQVSDSGLKEIQGLTRLQTLALGDVPVTDAGAAALSELSNLQELDLGLTRLTPSAVRSLRDKLPHAVTTVWPLRDDQWLPPAQDGHPIEPGIQNDCIIIDTHYFITCPDLLEKGLPS